MTPRCRGPHIIGEPCPNCWRVAGEDAGGGRPARAFPEPRRVDVQRLVAEEAAAHVRELSGIVAGLVDVLVLVLAAGYVERARAEAEVRALGDEAAHVWAELLAGQRREVFWARTVARLQWERNRALGALDFAALRLVRARAALPRVRAAANRRELAAACDEVQKELEGS